MIMSSNSVLCTFHGNVPFVAALLKAEARFLVVGGLAVKFYRRDRVVDDLDLLIEPTVSNAERVLGALSKFDPTHGRLPEELVAPGIHLQLKTFLYLKPCSEFYLDVLTPRKTWPSFESMWASSVPVRLAHLEVRLPSRQFLLAMQREASESDKDEGSRALHANDVMALERHNP